MHQSQKYISEELLPGTPSRSQIENYFLGLAEASKLVNFLGGDSIGYTYSATISIGDATLNIQKGLYTWATVKLYYSTFYAFRALLALNKICIFYVGRKPYALEVKAGKAPRKKDGPTHKVVLEEFRSWNSGHFLLSQQIGLSDPLEWLMEKREDANYKQAKFCEPEVPNHFKRIIDSGLRQSIQEYLSDTSGIYTFDPDHSMIAYPLKVLDFLYKEVYASGDFSLRKEDIIYLCNLFKDKKGPISCINTLIKRDVSEAS
jgi:hypothetical protein